MTSGALVVRRLERHGVEVVFGIPGTHNLPIYAALADGPIRHITPRHEQGAGYAADGYARASGRPGVVITTTGPGVLNAATAAAQAWSDSVPLLLIAPGMPLGSSGCQHRLPARDARPAPRAERGRGARGASRNSCRAVPRARRRVRLLRRGAAPGALHRGSARPARDRGRGRAADSSAPRAALAGARRDPVRRQYVVGARPPAGRRGRRLARRRGRARGAAGSWSSRDDHDQRQGRGRRAPPACAGSANTGRRRAADGGGGRRPDRGRIRPGQSDHWSTLEPEGLSCVSTSIQRRLTATSRPASPWSARHGWRCDRFSTSSSPARPTPTRVDRTPRGRRCRDDRARVARGHGLSAGAGGRAGVGDVVTGPDNAMVSYNGLLGSLRLRAGSRFLFPSGFRNPRVRIAGRDRRQARAARSPRRRGSRRRRDHVLACRAGHGGGARVGAARCRVTNGGYGEIRREMVEQNIAPVAVDLGSPGPPGGGTRARWSRVRTHVAQIELGAALEAAFERSGPTVITVPEV